MTTDKTESVSNSSETQQTQQSSTDLSIQFDELDSNTDTSTEQSMASDSSFSDDSCTKPSTPLHPARSAFDCNICLDAVNYPVVSQCGHLFCWSCISAWIKHQTNLNTPVSCPVCKALLMEDQLIPLYAGSDSDNGNGKSETDPRRCTSLSTPRPAQKRIELSSVHNNSASTAANVNSFSVEWHWSMFPGIQVDFSTFPNLQATVPTASFHTMNGRNGNVRVVEPRRVQVLVGYLLLVMAFLILYFSLLFHSSY